ncbi:hypothetical protein LOTGIDRAFT_160081 [Lottia gigantea]|uniref:Uncharacterized protein n=1 Tax=Lottia gigantea TaxID=225164 RepID=V4AQY5_LOTGI|nr:hypothetical protein LOTGIDRAFT_160081 [Lottia gigantea]ESO96096.1 hypothetical protein LOTGIDRAFT_160081 [Lottia gigantea]
MAGVMYYNENDSLSTHSLSQSEEEEDEYEMFGGVVGYQFECTCLRCLPMATVTESCCCLERPQIVKKVEENIDMFPENELVCITKHPGFKALLGAGGSISTVQAAISRRGHGL